MGYGVKWLEDNLGVTRKALRGFEKAGLMPKNEKGQYRNYDDDDIDRIWAIRVLQGIGYSLKEITNMANNEQFDFDGFIAKKVLELEEEKKKIERHLGYAKKIKLTGRLPSRPRKMGEVKFNEFQNESLEGWNIEDNSQEAEYAKLVETMLSKSSEEWDNTDLGRLLSSLELMMTLDIDLLFVEYVLPKEIIKRKHLGADHPEIQFMIKLIYENQKALGTVDGIKDITIEQFSRFYSSSYLSGDIAKLKTRDYSKEECEFIAEAVAIFGGFKNHDELVEYELRHGR